MKDHDGKASLPDGCHAQHVQLLDCLTDTLKDDLKRGLNLLDGCVNQLAQAKWIFINVERTIENYYRESECPACSPSGVPVGNRATSPAASVPNVVTPMNTNSVTVNATVSTAKKRETKTKKASVLPMVSGHTVQRPKINISRVDAKGKQKSKKEDRETTTSPRVRGRGAGSTTLALATASSHSGRRLDDSEDDRFRKNGDSAFTPSPSPKKRPGPLSKTRVKSDCSSEFRYNDADVVVNLDDVDELLNGRTYFSGPELNKFLKLVGLPLVKEEKQTEKNLKVTSSRSEESRKKRKLSTDHSDEEVDVDKKEKSKTADADTDSKPITQQNLTPISTKAPIRSDVIKSAFLKFAKTKIGSTSFAAVLENKAAKVNDDKSSPVETKLKVENKDASDSEDEVLKEKNKRTSPAKGRKGHSSDSDAGYSESSRKVKKSKPTRKVTVDNDSDDDDSDYKRTAKRSKKKASSDDSDFGTSVTSSTRKRTPRSGRKTVSKETISTSDSDSNVDEKPVKRNRKSSRSESPAGRNSKLSPVRRNSKNDKPTRRVSKNESPARSKANNSDDEEPKPRPKPGPASAKAKRSGGRPGPLSAKLKAEKEKQDENTEVDDSESNKKMNESKAQVTFTDSDSDDSEVKKIKKNIPLTFQDALRSPSPDGVAKDIFGHLLNTYNPGETSVSKLKKHGVQIKSKVFELNKSIQKKLDGIGKELVPYTGSVEADGSVFHLGKYYVVGNGKNGNEKLVLYDSSGELQQLEISQSDVDELLED